MDAGIHPFVKELRGLFRIVPPKDDTRCDNRRLLFGTTIRRESKVKRKYYRNHRSTKPPVAGEVTIRPVLPLAYRSFLGAAR